MRNISGKIKTIMVIYTSQFCKRFEIGCIDTVLLYCFEKSIFFFFSTFKVFRDQRNLDMI